MWFSSTSRCRISTGLKCCAEFACAIRPNLIPVIMVTGNSQSADIVKALDLGANDYIVKPVDFAVAFARVKAQVARKRASEALASANSALMQLNEQLTNEVASRQRYEAHTRYLSLHDALTGLGNRVLFREELQMAVEEPRVSGQSLAVLFIDLDGFKNVNDAHGHSVGDALLKMLSSRLLDSLGNTVPIARLGGDEFAILQTCRKQPEAAMLLANQLLELIAMPCWIDAQNLTVVASIGIAIGNGEDKDIDSLLRSADLAMYRAKADGGGTYRLFDPEMDADAQAALQLKLEMRNALANDNFEVHYQPIISTATRQVTAFEALLRWKHDERGWVSPAEFIPVAENTGLIVKLGEWVLRKACADASTWPNDVKVTVNLSPLQFQNGKLVATVVSVLAASGLAPARLELEITESVLLDRSDRNLVILKQLRQLGVRISLDDFGTGNSSLSFLRTFTFDKIKIDQSFIHDLLEDGRSDTIVGAIAGLGASFGIATTAEGVESESQIERVIAKGCTEMQGYFYSRAVPSGDVLALIGSVNGKSQN